MRVYVCIFRHHTTIKHSISFALVIQHRLMNLGGTSHAESNKMSLTGPSIG